MKNKTLEAKERAYRYHVKGLTFQEIGKLLDLSSRTIEKYSQIEGWKLKDNPNSIKDKAKELRERGFSCAVIARKIGVSKSTVHNYLSALNVKKQGYEKG